MSRRRHGPDWSRVLLDRIAERRRFALGLGALAAAGYLALALVGFALGWAACFLAGSDGGVEAPAWVPWLAALVLPALALLPVPWFLAHPDAALDVEGHDADDLRQFLPGSDQRVTGDLLLKTVAVMPQTLAEALRLLLPGRGWTDERLTIGAGMLGRLFRADGWVPLGTFLRDTDAAQRGVLAGLVDLDLAWTRPAPMTREHAGGGPVVRLNPQLIP